MKREIIYYAIIGLGAVIVGGIGLSYLLNKDSPTPLAPPPVVEERLTDQDAPPEKRVEAARDLLRHGEQARMEIRRAVAQHEQHEPQVLATLLQATGKTRDYRSMPELIELLRHEDPLIRGRAGAAIQKIMGVDFFYRANDSPQRREEIIKMIEDDYHNSSGMLKEFYNDQLQ